MPANPISPDAARAIAQYAVMLRQSAPVPTDVYEEEIAPLVSSLETLVARDPDDLQQQHRRIAAQTVEACDTIAVRYQVIASIVCHATTAENAAKVRKHCMGVADAARTAARA